MRVEESGAGQGYHQLLYKESVSNACSGKADLYMNNVGLRKQGLNGR
jgi:hypothetical protein